MPREVAVALRSPTGLGSGGRFLWRAIADANDLDAAQQVQLTEACRAKDRLDKLDQLLRGDVDTWLAVRLPEQVGDPVRVVVNSALREANATANVMKQLLAAMRLPDEATGRRPQVRGGAQRPTVPGGRLSSLDRARSAKSS